MGIAKCGGRAHWKGVAATRHLLGYLCCLAFVVFALTSLGFFPNIIRNIEENANIFLDGFASDPTLGPIVHYTAHPFGLSIPPALVFGHFVAIVVSPIGLFTLLFYFLIVWMLPAR